MADVLHIQNTHGTLDWLASGGHVTMRPQNFHQKKKTGETYEQKSQWLKNTDFRLIFSSLVASYSLVATVEDDVTWKVHASWDGIFPQKVEWTHLKSNQVRQMRFHTCILKGPIPFMTHSSLLISNVNCWSGMLPQSKTARPWFITKKMHQSQHVKMPKTSISFHSNKVSFSCFFPQEIHTEKATIWRSLKCVCFCVTFFCVHKILKLIKNFHKKKTQAEQRGPGGTHSGLQQLPVVLNVANLPELVTSIKPQRRFQNPIVEAERNQGLSSMLIPGW